MPKRSKNWIKGAIKKPGALRATAKRQGALKADGTIKKSWLKDKAKGKAKVLARRDKNKKPEPKPIPKGLRESIAKNKKIVKVTPKKKPVEKNKLILS